MHNPQISYDIKINTGKYAGQIIEFNCKLDELQDSGLDRLLIEYNILDVICNKNEYQVIHRDIEL